MTPDRREQILSDALDPVEIALSGRAYVLEAVLPLMDAMCAEAAADALRDAANGLSDWVFSATDPRDYLRAVADRMHPREATQ